MNEKEIAVLLYNALKGDAGFSAVVGSGNAQRFYANWAPAGAKMPYAVYSIGSSEPLTKDGGTRWPVSVGLVFPPDGYLDALELEEKILDALQDTDFEVLDAENKPDPEKDCFIRYINLQITNF